MADMVKTRLLASVADGGGTVKFGPDIFVQTKATGDFYRVEVKGKQPDGFNWNEYEQMAWWEGTRVDEAVIKVNTATGGPVEGPVEEAEKEFTLTAKGMSLPEVLGEPVVVTKPYSKVSDAPANIRKLDGASLTLAQVNYIARVADGIGEQEGIESPWAVAIAQFKKGHKKEGDKWVKKKKELDAKNRDLQDELNAIRDAFWAQFDPGRDAKEPGPYVEEIEEAFVIARDGMRFFRVPYAIVEGKPVFTARDSWAEVKQTYAPVADAAAPKQYAELTELAAEVGMEKEPLLRMVIAVTKAMLTKKDAVTTVWKEDGRRFYMALVSMAVHDDEEQLVTKEGMDFSIALSKKYNYHSGLYVRHVVPLSRVGKSLYERRMGPYWIEVGEFDDTPLAIRAFEVLESDKEGEWKLSIGFLTTKDQAEEGCYTRLLKYDSTITNRPALRLTQMLAVGGKDKMDALAKVLELLQSDGGKDTDMKMLAEVFGVEEKELVAKVKEQEGLAQVRAAIEAMEDGDEKKKLMAALGGGKGDDDKDKDKGKDKTKETNLLPEPIREALKEMLKGEAEPVAEPVVAEPALDADVIKTAVEEAMKPLVERVDALEALPKMDDLVKEVKDVFEQYKPKDPKPPADTAPVLTGDVAALITELTKSLGTAPTGKHALSGFAHGPGADEGG